MKEFDVSNVHLVQNVSLQLSQYSRYWAYSAEKIDEVPALKRAYEKGTENKQRDKQMLNQYDFF